jgi:hypothetical protein
MPAIAIFAAIGVGAFVAWRVVQAVVDATTAPPPDRSSAPVKPPAEGATARDLGSLEFDPKSGVYKPKT